MALLVEIENFVKYKNPDHSTAKRKVGADFLSIVREMQMIVIDQQQIASSAIESAIGHNLSMAQALTYVAAVAKNATLITSGIYF